MKGSAERCVIRFSKKNPKLLRWLELTREERGYVGAILAPLLWNFLAPGKILKIGTVNPQLCTHKEDWTITVSIQTPNDPVLTEKLATLRTQRKINSFLIGLFDRAIEEGVNESIMPSWDFCAKILLQSPEDSAVSSSGSTEQEKPVLHKPVHYDEQNKTNVNIKPVEPEDEAVISQKRTIETSVKKEISSDNTLRDMKSETKPKSKFSFGSSSSGAKIRELMGRSSET